MTKRDAQVQLEVELDKLLKTSNDELTPFLTGEMNRFSSLFRRFLSEEGPSVDWDKIEKLPEEAVKHYDTLSLPKEDQVSYKMKKWKNRLQGEWNICLILSICFTDS